MPVPPTALPTLAGVLKGLGSGIPGPKRGQTASRSLTTVKQKALEVALDMLSSCAEHCQARTDFCMSDLGFAGSFYLETNAAI